MTPEQKAKHFDNIIYSDCFADLVIYSLKMTLKNSIDDLEDWSKTETWSDAVWEDFVETLKYCRSVIAVLEYFSVEKFTKETIQLNKYSLKLEEVF